MVEPAEENYKKELRRATCYVGEMEENLIAGGTEDLRLARGYETVT